MATKPLYYIEVTTRRGKRELIAIDTETDTHVKGRIIASELVPGDVGIGWSNTKKVISEDKKYNFTLKPKTEK